MIELFDSNDKVARFLITFLVVCIILSSMIYAVLEMIGSNDSVEISAEGLFSISASSSDGGNTTFFSVPASSFWYDTGLEIPPQAKVSIEAQGSVHLSANDLISSVKDGIKPNMKWTDPEGDSIVKNKPIHRHMKRMAMDSTAKYGRLLASLYPSKAKYPPGIDNPNPSDNQIFNIGSQNSFANTSGKNCRLYLIVNDNFIDPRDSVRFKGYFVGNEEIWKKMALQPCSIANKIQENTTKFNNIRNEQYWNIFYDDNIGNFFVKVSVN